MCRGENLPANKSRTVFLPSLGRVYFLLERAILQQYVNKKREN